MTLTSSYQGLDANCRQWPPAKSPVEVNKDKTRCRNRGLDFVVAQTLGTVGGWREHSGA